MSSSRIPQLHIPIQVLDPSVEMPSYQHRGDAGLDIRSTVDLELAPFQRALIPAGFALSIPEGYAGFLLPRSGSALRTGLTLINTPGLIDSHYRGEIKLPMVNLDPDTPVRIERGDRIAQLVVLPTPQVVLREVPALDTTIRGEGGFGSTGLG